LFGGTFGELDAVGHGGSEFGFEGFPGDRAFAFDVLEGYDRVGAIAFVFFGFELGVEGFDEVEDLGQGGVGEGGEFLDEAFSGGHGFVWGSGRAIDRGSRSSWWCFGGDRGVCRIFGCAALPLVDTAAIVNIVNQENFNVVSFDAIDDANLADAHTREALPGAL
jgi:hypothetical protein